MSTPPTLETRALLPAVAILGTDAVLAAAPATAVQVAHACLARGFDVAVPASWGDELVAAEMVRRLAKRERGPAIACACPYVRARLQAAGADLGPFLLALAPPPVALARYLRALYGARGVRISYIGACPAGNDASIDERFEPMEFYAQLAGRGISLVDQPKVFDSVVPPDRRRWCSIPGGVPAPELLWSEGGARALVEIAGEDVSSEIAEQVIANARALVDLAPALGCACSGAASGTAAREARAVVASQEPPRALGPVIDPGVPVSFEPPPGPPPPTASDRARRAGSAAPATPPADLRSASAGEGSRSRYWHVPSLPETRPPAAGTPSAPALGLLDEETLSSAALFRPDASRRRQSRRPNAHQLPRARDDAGRTLPRAYVGRRRGARGPRSSDVELRLHPSVEPEVSARVAPDTAQPATDHAAPREPAVSEAASAGERLDARAGSAGSAPAAAHSAPEPPPALESGGGEIARPPSTDPGTATPDLPSTAAPADAPAAPTAPLSMPVRRPEMLPPPSHPARDPFGRRATPPTGAVGTSPASGGQAGDPSGDALRQRLRQSAAGGEPHPVPPHVPEQDSALRTMLFLATIVACVMLAVFVLLSL